MPYVSQMDIGGKPAMGTLHVQCITDGRDYEDSILQELHMSLSQINLNPAALSLNFGFAWFCNVRSPFSISLTAVKRDTIVFSSYQ